MKIANKGRLGIFLALAAAVTCSSAIAISQLCFEEGNGVIPAMAETTSGVTARTMTAAEISSNWSKAVQDSIDGGTQVKFTLEDNWTAETDTTYTTSFGSGTGFSFGGIYVPSGADIVLDLNGYTIDRNLSAKYGSGYVICVAGSLEIADSSISGTGTITGGYAYSGGGVYTADGNVKLIMSGGKICGNNADYGGGVYVGGSYTLFEMTGGEISGNTATSYAGGVYISGDVGGGIFKMNGGTISGNTANTEGGGVYNIGGVFEMNGGTISGNELTSTSSNGGGVYLSYSTFTMTGGEISGNTAGYGGGVYIINSSSFTMTGGTIGGSSTDDANTANTNGGGVYVNSSSSSFTMTGGEISGNTTSGNGGGVYQTGSSSLFSMSAGTITGNTASNQGGGVYAYGPFTMSDTATISNNKASGNGGGVRVYSYAFTMNGGTISGNTSGGTGGGIYQGSGTVTINSGTIAGNTATTNGGGIYMSGNSLYVTGGVVFGNTKSDGSANNVYLSGTTYYINVTGKLASTTYIGVYATAARTVTSGYVTGGNKAGRETTYFTNDNPSYVISNNGSEVTLIAATSATAKTAIDWSYKSYDSNFQNPQSVTVEESALSASATYTGGAFVFDAVTSGLVSAVDENGKPVSAFTNVGTYYLSVIYTVRNNYTNPFFTFEILPADISELSLAVTADPVTYSGSEVTTSVRVYNGGVMLVENTDYTVSYENNVNAGEGNVIITAMGNYKGTASKSFTIEKAKLAVRWGLKEATYTGEAVGITVYPEGLIGSDKVTLTLTYTDKDGNTVSPVDVGTYIAKVSLDDPNYKLSSTFETYFYVVEQKVDVVWSETEFTYDGNPHTLTAYFMDGSTKVDLTVTLEETTSAGTYTATAALPSGYENFALTGDTSTVTYKIEKAEVEAVWGEYEFTYDGDEKEIEVTLTGLNGEDLSDKVTYTYYNEEGKKVTPVDAGTYTVEITFTDDNYKLAGKTEDTFVIAKQNLVVTLDENFDGEYSGEGKTPLLSVEDEDGNAIDYTVTYALVDDKGNVLNDLGETLPTDAGKYVLTVEVDNVNIEQTSYTANFEITAKTLTVVWDFGDNAMEIDGVYTYLYDGTAHQPTAKAGDIELTVKGTGKAVGKGYKAVASTDNANYILDGTLEVTFNVIQSKVSNVLWYEYGATEPVADGVKPSYEYIFVYGQEEGAKLSAYGVLTAADDTLGWSVSEECLVKLNVTYNTYSEGFWSIGTYTASANLSSADKTNDMCYMPLGINDTLEFEVTAITHSASVAQILWVVVVDGKHVLASDYKFIYDGNPQTPIAILILSNSYDSNDPDPDTFKILNVTEGYTDAGEYYAYIIPDSTATYEIKAEDSECKFVIAPAEVEIEWDDVDSDGNIVVTYNGEKQAPTASVVGDNDLSCVIKTEGYVNAGTYTVKADVGNNFTVKGSDEITFVIEQLKLDNEAIVWGFETDDEGEVKTGADGVDYFIWEYDGNVHTPTATLKVVLVEGNDPVEIKLSVTGGTSKAGSHYAYVTLESTDPSNANFELDIAKIKFEIVQDAVTVIWEDANDDGEIILEYTGSAYQPKAYYLDSEGNKVELTVVGSGTNAGDYVACVTDDITASNSKTIVFTIKAKELKADWDKTTVNYNGTERAPEVTFYEVDEEGNETEVTLRLGVDYTVSGYTNAGTYVSEITLINVNYTVTDGGLSHEFIINKKEVTLTWANVNDDGVVVFNYNGSLQVPTAETSVEGLEITVKGAETDVGTYTAVAVLNNDNYTITNPEQEFVINGRIISIVWVGNEDAEEGEDEFSWQYEGDGRVYLPDAYYLDDEGEKVYLTVVGGGIYAGDYTAIALCPAGCAWADGETGECKFTVTKKIVKGIVWEFEGATEKVDEDGNTYYELTFDGEYHIPTAKIASTGEVLTVLGAAVNKGEYTATAVLANSENYEFAPDGVDYELRFVIIAKTVSVTWKGENDDENDFEWAYDGEVHCPTAWFEDVNGNWVQIPVIGGSASGGEHLAEIRDVFDNYEFNEAKHKKSYTITEVEITVEWTESDNYSENDDGEITYTYTYDGVAKMPEVTAKDGAGKTVSLNYVITLGGETVGAIIDAGEYVLTVSPSDKNNKIDSDCVTQVKVIVKALEVTVNWDGKDNDGNIIFTYNGVEQAPKAWFEYVDGNGKTIIITLTVEGAGKEVDEYTATVALESDNFVLTGDTEITFSIVADTSTEWKWDWDLNDGVGDWVEVTAETDPTDPPAGGDGEEGETPDGGNDGDETVDPDNGNDGEETETPDGGNDGEESVDPDDGNDGETPDPDNPATPPESGESGSESGKDDDDNGDGDSDGDGSDPADPDDGTDGEETVDPDDGNSD